MAPRALGIYLNAACWRAIAEVRRLAQASMCTVCGMPAKRTESTPRSICLVAHPEAPESSTRASADAPLCSMY